MFILIELVQSWYHFEDKVNPSQGRLVRQVADFYTDEQFISFYIPSYFVKCKIKSRFKGNELEFIQENSNFTVNLGDLNDWPCINEANDDVDNLKHVKIEIEYIFIRPKFEERISWKNIFKTGYCSTCDINEITQPEFYLTVPRGMKINHENPDSVMLLAYYNYNNDSIAEILNLEKEIFFEYINKKLSYHFLIDSISYDSILSKVQNNEIDLSRIKFNYKVENQRRYWFITFFPLFLIFITLVNIFTSPSSEITNLNLSGIIIFISFLTFYYSLIREGYEIPFNKSLGVSIPLAGFFLLFPKLVYSFIF